MVSVTHPRTGAAEDLRVTAELLAGLVTGALYSPMTASMMPELLVRAEADDFQGLLALATLGESAGENMSTGMQLSVICAEDVPRIGPGDAERETAGTLFARHLLTSRMKPCEFWPAGPIAASYYEPVRSDVPALVLSGDVDPVTPPTWGAEVSAHLSRRPARHRAGHRARRDGHRLRPAPGRRVHRAWQRRWPRHLVRDVVEAAAVLPDARRSGSGVSRGTAK